ncbi:JM83 [macacine gammaherpesvirus 11]|uniref:JM83 n=2 Tax=macacine gammaherpesvirus 11 TaxID=2560570 RepID=G9JM91_9GAMA|nr:JM83 [Macaca fuscata rhadinovirus]AAT00060.1 JM83 [Macaca fuscata rhadinovirus]AEW87608.1 JM83 [Macaca fuscata rhadinovirus]AEW87778.1 JM83 [Macaca fuscata rhadinovirus]
MGMADESTLSARIRCSVYFTSAAEPKFGVFRSYQPKNCLASPFRSSMQALMVSNSLSLKMQLWYIFMTVVQKKQRFKNTLNCVSW